MHPDVSASLWRDERAEVVARTLAGAVIGGLLIAAIHFASTRESVSVAASAQLVYLARLAVHWTLASIPLGIAIGVLELKNSRVSIGDGIRQCLSNQQPMLHEWFFTTVQLILAGRCVRCTTTSARTKAPGR